MSDHKNLSGKEGIQKLKQLIDAENVCLLTTSLDKTPLTVRPMGTADVDDQGHIWFLSEDGSDKNNEISVDNRVQLFYSNKGSQEYLSIYGLAEILRDQTKIDQVWTPIAKAWFKEGKTDPTIRLIKVVPHDAYYWDTKVNKMITLVKFAASALSGANFDDGVEGKIHL